MLYLYAMNAPTPPTSAALLKKIAEIQQMERGSISVLRKTPDGPFYNHQTWENGRKVSRYVPRDQIPALQEANHGYHQFQQLTQEYADPIIHKTRTERAAQIKRDLLLKSSSPKTPKSRN